VINVERAKKLAPAAKSPNCRRDRCEKNADGSEEVAACAGAGAGADGRTKSVIAPGCRKAIERRGAAADIVLQCSSAQLSRGNGFLELRVETVVGDGLRCSCS